MRIILVEFSWQAKEILDKKKSLENYVIVSLDPESSYILKSNKIPYFETYQFCNHKELWFKYKEITEHTIKIAKVLDEALWHADKRFRDLKWKFFNDYHYCLKISFDQLFYYAELISKLIEKFNPSEIIVADTNKVTVDDYWLLINHKVSVIKYLLKTLEGTSSNIKISLVLPSQNENLMSTFFCNFKKNNLFTIKNLVKEKVKNIYYKLNFLINYHILKPKYLAIGCFEILRYKKLYPNQSKFFLSYYHDNLNRKRLISDLTFFDKFMKYLKNETNFYMLIKHRNISFKIIFHEILYKLAEQLDFLFNEYNKNKRIIDQIKPTCVIFQSLSHAYSANITFKKVCIDLKIPFTIWMHGGLGLNYSLGGFDVTDFRFCKNHIAYGPYLRDLITNNKCILKKLEFIKNYNILPIGSPKLDYENMKKNLNKILKPNEKKTIIFFASALVFRNRFYFGHNREKFETSLWEFHYDIINIFKKYQNKYNIIFKDYPKGHKGLWKKILKDIKANKILYVSDERSVNDLLRTSDLNITPWTSTTFFEALHFDADIFAMEEDLFSKHLSQELRDEIFYFTSEEKFKQELKKYLEIGIFYKCKKENSKNYFINYGALGRRDKLLNEALDNISKSNQ